MRRWATAAFLGSLAVGCGSAGTGRVPAGQEGALEAAVRRAQRHLDDDVLIGQLRSGPYGLQHPDVRTVSLLVHVEGPSGSTGDGGYADSIQRHFERMGVTVLRRAGGEATVHVELHYEPIIANYVPTDGGGMQSCHVDDHVEGSLRLELGDIDEDFDFEEEASKPPGVIPFCSTADGGPPAMSRILRDHLLDLSWRIWGARALAVGALDLDVTQSEFEWRALELLGPDAVEPVLQVLSHGASDDNVVHAFMLLENVPRWSASPGSKRQLAALVRACQAPGNAERLRRVVESIDPEAAKACIDASSNLQN